MRALIVGFEDSERPHIEEAFAQAGFEPTVCGKGREALHACRAIAFPVILFEANLPDIDRNELLTRLRALPGGARAHIICGMPDGTPYDALDLGADDLLLLPLDPEDLRRRLAVAVRRTAADTDADDLRNRLAHLLSSSPAVVFSGEPGGEHVVTYLSENVRDLMGYTAAEILEDPGLWFERIHADDAEELLAALEAGCPSGPTRHEYRHRHANGEWRWVLQETRCIRDEAGEPEEVVGSLIDVSARRQADEERGLLLRSIEQATDIILIATPEGEILYVNPAFTRITGYTSEEISGRNVKQLHGEGRSESDYDTARATIDRGEPWMGRMLFRRKDGRMRELEGTVSPIREGTGQVINVVAVLRDVSYEGEMEEQVRQAQKMEAVGRLAGGVAHEFNNLLTAIGGHADLLLEESPEPDPRRRRIEHIMKATARAGSLTRQLLAFSRRQVMDPRELDLNLCVSELEAVLERLVGEEIELLCLLEPELGRVKADPGQIEQVLLNLALNAREAMPDGGMLTIETTNVVLEDRQSSGALPVPPGRYVQVSVSDTGRGMDAETRERIFEPFFTTKEDGRVSGLGLSTAYGVINQSRGGIWVYSEPEIGTTFKIYLPRIESVTAPAARPDLPGGDETILLVEDERLVRNLTREMLQARGYTVIDAAGGAEALALLAATGEHVRLLLTDVVMPEMSGPELAVELGGKRPDIRVLFMSGYTDTAIVRRGVIDRGTPLLEKPFSQVTLAKRVRQALDA